MPHITDSRNFDKQPLWFRMVNAAWRRSYFLGTKIKLDKDHLIRSAQKDTGLTDLGRDFNDEPLERLLWSVNHEASLHPLGRFITFERLKSLIAIRLRAENLFGRFPEILEQPLYPAWVIIGLQRTGTTKLQRLLATDPRHRVLPSWEVISPVPGELGITNYELRSELRITNDELRRKKIARTSARAVKFMSPGFYAIHPIEVDQPEEDILLLDISFMSTTAEAMMHVPSYSSWLEGTDQAPAYEYYVKILKLLQWLRPAERWVLKTPHHLEFLDIIEKTFDKVHFVWPHRTLHRSVPSFLSMVSYNRMMFSSDVTPDDVASHWVRKTGYMLDRALEFRSQPGKENLFTDILYKDLISKPIDALSRLYALDGGLSPALEAGFRKNEKENPQRKYGTHQYSLKDFGLTPRRIDEISPAYQQFIKNLYGEI